jgi:ankyrin repeat protein
VQDKNPATNVGTTPLHLAAQRGHEEIFKAIFKEIKDKNPGDNHGWTPLHYAFSQGNLQLCQFIDRKNHKSSHHQERLDEMD